jgi:peroxiredoxin
MKRFLFLSLLASAMLFAAGELSNRRAPGFSIVDAVNLEQHDLADYRGKYVVLDFMQTNCPHCQQFSGILEKVASQFKGRVQVLSIVVPPDNLDTVKKYIQGHNITVPILFDSGQVMASYLKLTPATPTVFFPHAFIVDPTGKIVNDWVYTSDGKNKGIFEEGDLAKELDRLIAAAPRK